MSKASNVSLPVQLAFDRDNIYVNCGEGIPVIYLGNVNVVKVSKCTDDDQVEALWLTAGQVETLVKMVSYVLKEFGMSEEGKKNLKDVLAQLNMIQKKIEGRAAFAKAASK